MLFNDVIQKSGELQILLMVQKSQTITGDIKKTLWIMRMIYLSLN